MGHGSRAAALPPELLAAPNRVTLASPLRHPGVTLALSDTAEGTAHRSQRRASAPQAGSTDNIAFQPFYCHVMLVRDLPPSPPLLLSFVVLSLSLLPKICHSISAFSKTCGSIESVLILSR